VAGTIPVLAAGADGVFVPGAVDPETMRPLVDGVDGELKVRAGPGGRRSPNWPNSASYA
jgi:2-methylisocitrate lyase-like PEP mutase family enzyme